MGQTAAEYSRSLKAQTRSAARATLEAALERRETRRCHNRSHYPQLDESLQVTFVWSPTTGVTREEIPPIPEEIAALIREVSTVGKLVE